MAVNSNQVIPLVYGRNVVVQPLYWTRFLTGSSETPPYDTQIIISEWEIDSIVQVVINGEIIPESGNWQLYVTGENSGDSTLYDYRPTVSMLSIRSGIIPDPQADLKSIWITVNGIKHYGYASNGDVLTSTDITTAGGSLGGSNASSSGYGDGKACAHKLVTAGNAVTTNPFLVVGHVLLNVFGVEKDLVDFDSLRTMALWAENPTWGTTTVNDAYDVRFYLNKSESLAKVLDKIIPPSCWWQQHQGVFKFGRKGVPTDEVGWTQPSFRFDDTSIMGEISLSHYQESETPTHINTHFPVMGTDGEGRYYHFTVPYKLGFPDIKRNLNTTKVVDLDLSYLYDADEFFNASGDSIPMLEALLYYRHMVQLDRQEYTFRTTDKRALLLEPWDQIRVYAVWNSVTIDADGAAGENKVLTFWSSSLNEDGTVTVVARPHDDSWWNPDPSADIGSGIQVNASGGPGDFPTYRFELLANISTGSDAVSITYVSALGQTALDTRSIRPGMRVWAEYNNDVTPGTEADWAHYNKWAYIGEVSSFSGSTITLTANAAKNINTTTDGQYIQICPQCTVLNNGKEGVGIEWLYLVQHYKPDWRHANSPKVTWKVKNDWFASPISWVREQEQWSGRAPCTIPFVDGGFTRNRESEPAGTTTMPLAIRMRKRNSNGVFATGSEINFYTFPDTLAISKETNATTAIDLIAQSAVDGCDYNELGLKLKTNYDPDDHVEIKVMDIRYSTSAAITEGTFAGATQVYLGPPFVYKTLREFVTTVKMSQNLHIGMKVLNEAGEYIEDTGTDVFTAETLVKEPRFWKNFVGVIADTTGAEGAGSVLVTNEWTEWASDWDPTIADDLYSGGFYMYPKHPDAGAADVDKWRRYGIVPLGHPSDPVLSFEQNGPSHALENTGDAKLCYLNIGSGTDPYWNWPQNESGILGYSWWNQTYKRGEWLIGLGKAAANIWGYNRLEHGTGKAIFYNALSQNYTTTANRGAAIWVAADRLTGNDKGTHVVVQGLAAMGGAWIGGMNHSIGNFVDQNIMPNARASRFYTTADGVAFGYGGGVAPLEPFLISMSQYPSSGNIHVYPYVHGRNGITVFQNPTSNSSSLVGISTDESGVQIELMVGLLTSDNIGSTSGTRQTRYLNQSPYSDLLLGVSSTTNRTGATGHLDATWYFYSSGGTYKGKAYLNGGWREWTLT